MSLMAENTGSKIPQIEPGTYTAICYGVVDFGNQYSEKFEKSSHKVRIMWEIPGEIIDTDEGQVTRTMSKEYTCSLGEKASLRKDLENWRGRPFTDEELHGFDLRKVLGVPCQLSIISKQKNDGSSFSDIGAVIKMAKGVPAPQPTKEHLVFDLDDPNYPAVLETLPEWMQKRIKESETYKEISGGVSIDDPFFDPSCPFN